MLEDAGYELSYDPFTNEGWVRHYTVRRMMCGHSGKDYYGGHPETEQKNCEWCQTITGTYRGKGLE